MKCLYAGGGLAGLSAANKLAKSGHPVTVYDMGTRGPGAFSSGSTSLYTRQRTCSIQPWQHMGHPPDPDNALWVEAGYWFCSLSSWLGVLAPGGRASTRQVEHDGTALQFDHGSQFLRVSDPAVQQHAREWEQQGELHLAF